MYDEAAHTWGLFELGLGDLGLEGVKEKPSKPPLKRGVGKEPNKCFALGSLVLGFLCFAWSVCCCFILFLFSILVAFGLHAFVSYYMVYLLHRCDTCTLKIDR